MDEVVDYLREIVVELNFFELSKCEFCHFYPARLNHSINALSENLVERMYFFHSALILTGFLWVAAPVATPTPVAAPTPIATFTFAGPFTTLGFPTASRSPGSSWFSTSTNDCTSSRTTTLTLTAGKIFYLFIVFGHLTIIFHIK